jgi:hypothetical protein
MLPLEESWTIEVLTVHLEVRIPEVHQPLTEDELDWNWHHWKKIESLLRYPEPYYAKELTRIVLEINEAVNGRANASMATSATSSSGNACSTTWSRRRLPARL